MISGWTTDACKEKLPSFILWRASLILRPKVRHKSNFDIRLFIRVFVLKTETRLHSMAIGMVRHDELDNQLPKVNVV